MTVLPRQVRAAHLAGAPRSYTVEPGKRLKDSWELNADAAYELSVFGDEQAVLEGTLMVLAHRRQPRPRSKLLDAAKDLLAGTGQARHVDRLIAENAVKQLSQFLARCCYRSAFGS